MGIEPHLHLWNHFFRARLLSGSGTKVAVFGGVDIYVKCGHGVDPYYHLFVSESMDEWWKLWFIMRMSLMRRSPCSRAAAPSPNPTRGTECPRGTSVGCNTCVRSFNSYDKKG
jgi:hypothetical protein